MRIAMITTVHSALDTRILHRESVALARAGHDVIVIAPHAASEVRSGVRIEAVPRPAGRLDRATRTMWRVFRRAGQLRPEVYHLHDPELIPAGLWLRLWGAAVVYDLHEDLPRTFAAKYYLPAALRGPLAWLAGRFENLACRRFSALVAATPTIAARAARLHRRTALVQNFPSPDEFVAPETISWVDREPAVAYLGALAANRGLQQMVDAMGLLPNDLPATLHLAGTYWPPSLRDEMARRAGWRRVVEMGHLDRRPVADLLARVRVGLVLLHAEPRYQLAYPTKLFEYMAAGVPVIASDFPLWRQIVEEAGCGLLVDPLDPRAIAAAITRLLTRPEEAERMGRRGREAMVRRHSWPNEAEKLIRLYDDLAHLGVGGLHAATEARPSGVESQTVSLDETRERRIS
jgi:glycosyltransferase involved in cell wall biosynthesis